MYKNLKTEASVSNCSSIRQENTVQISPIYVLEEKNKVFGNDLNDLFPKTIGNLRVLSYQNNEPLIVIGPQFHFSLILASIIMSVLVIIAIFIYPTIHIIYSIFGIIIYVSQLICQFYTALINPGIPSKSYFISHNSILKIDCNGNFDLYQYCGICHIIMKNNNSVIHCSLCNICIEKHDHHCKWIGKCIGKNNLVSFWMFIITTVSFFFYNTLILFIKFISII